MAQTACMPKGSEWLAWEAQERCSVPTRDPQTDKQSVPVKGIDVTCILEAHLLQQVCPTALTQDRQQCSIINMADSKCHVCKEVCVESACTASPAKLVSQALHRRQRTFTGVHRFLQHISRTTQESCLLNRRGRDALRRHRKGVHGAYVYKLVRIQSIYFKLLLRHRGCWKETENRFVMLGALLWTM